MAPSYRNSDTPPPIMRGSPPALVPPRADWDRPPWNRWSFQNIRQILPTAEVWRGEGPVRQLPRREQDLDALPVDQQVLTRAIEDVAAHVITGVNYLALWQPARVQL